MTSIRSFATALTQGWWAFETLMNDFAGIILEQRRAALDQVTIALLEERRIGLDKAGAIASEQYNQPILARLQFIYRYLTGEDLQRGAREWQRLVALKEARDAYVHRIGKGPRGPGAFDDDSVIVDGFASVRDIIGRVFLKTPEFSAKFVYRFLAYWSCGSEVPFIWDGQEGDGFYLGLGSVRKEAVVALFAPMPGSFSVERLNFGHAQQEQPRPRGLSKPRRRRRR